jgi:HAD superfamily hydrolase (TIGR01509 family)
MLDVDYTLLRPSWLFEAPGYLALGRSFGLELEAARWHDAERAAFAAAVERRKRLGDEHDDGLMRAIAETVIRTLGGDDEARVQAAADEQIDRWHRIENYALYDDVLPCLRRLDEAGVPVALVSNTARDLLEAVEYFGLSRFVAAKAASAEVGVMKPHPEIFAVVLDELDLAPTDAVMVGDSYHDDVLGAQAAGMTGILLDRAGRSSKDVPTIRSLAELPPALGL